MERLLDAPGRRRADTLVYLECLATISARIAYRAVTALRRARCPAGLRGPRRADRIQRIGLARSVPVLPVRPVYFHHPDVGRGQVPGQARPVAAGPLDADQGKRAEPAQPVQQPRVPGRGGRELLDAQQPAERIQRGRDMQIGVGVYAARDDSSVFYDGHSRPFHG